MRDVAPDPCRGAREALEAAFRRGHRAWPELDLDRERFERHLIGKLGEPPDSSVLATLRVDELYLACACSLGNAAALAAFEASYVPAIDAALKRARLDVSAIDELRQELRVWLFLPTADREAGILGFGGRGQLRGWLRIVAVRSARRKMPLRAATHEDEYAAWLVADDANPELSVLKATYQQQFERALATALQGLPDRDRSILALSLVDRLPPEQIARIYRVHRTTIIRWITRTIDGIRARLREILISELRVDDAQYESILRLIGYRLEMSLTTHLGPVG